MILFIALGILLAKIKGNRVSVVFKEISLLPLFILEILFWYFQMCVWMGNYSFIQYASMIQSLYILSLLWPVLKYKLFGYAVAGSGLVAVGSYMNKLVMNANAGRMPVYPSISKYTGYFVNGALEVSGDLRHVIMSDTTKLKYLGDYIDVGFSIMSPGDVLMHIFITLVIFGTINEFNRKGKG